jgi:hypothetical protein
VRLLVPEGIFEFKILTFEPQLLFEVVVLVFEVGSAALQVHQLVINVHDRPFLFQLRGTLRDVIARASCGGNCIEQGKRSLRVCHTPKIVAPINQKAHSISRDQFGLSTKRLGEDRANLLGCLRAIPQNDRSPESAALTRHDLPEVFTRSRLRSGESIVTR